MNKTDEKKPLAIRKRIAEKERRRLMNAHLRYVKRLIENNAPVSTYDCPDCGFRTVTLIPKHNQVEPDKPYFDTATSCPNCGVVLFVEKYCDGKIKISHLSNLM